MASETSLILTVVGGMGLTWFRLTQVSWGRGEALVSVTFGTLAGSVETFGFDTGFGYLPGSRW